MAAAAAEQINTWEIGIAEQPPQLPLVISVPEIMPTDLRAERLIRSAGALALETQVEVVPIAGERLTSLMDAIHQAAGGNETARMLVEANVRTDAIERTIKAGHVLSVELNVDENGSLLQHGQTMESIQANTLRFAANAPQMRSRAVAETRNAYRIENLNRQGMLDDYNFVVFSRAADDMTTREMKDAGFFMDTMSCAIQVTSARENKIVTESAFVAGLKTPGAARHDSQAVLAVGEALGVDYDKSATDTIDSPILVHKSLMPNGAIDLVRLYDQAAGGMFFGEAKPQLDYIAYLQACEEREKGFEPKVQAIVNELLSVSVNTPLEATEQLDKLSQKHMVEKAVEDITIDPAVFGPAASHIEMARWHLELGNTKQARSETTQAISTAKSSSCASGKSQSGGGPSDSPEAGSDGGGESSGSDDSSEDCEFVSKECPECGAKNVKTTIKRLGSGKKHIQGACGCSKVA